MDDKAIINGGVVQLTAEETEGAAKFHLSRLLFAWVHGELKFNTNNNDDRDHQHWLCEDFGLTLDEYEHTNRGYIKDDRVQLFIGSTFSPLDTSEISTTDFFKLIKKHAEIYGTSSVKVYNGVKIGKVGEVWDPIIELGTFSA